MLKRNVWIGASVASILVLIFGFCIFKNVAAVRKAFAGHSLITGLKVEREKVRQKAMMITINHYRPDLTKWKNFIEQGATLDARFLSDSIMYYRLISDLAPQMAETHHLLGLCYYLSNKKDEALEAQSQAVRLEPRFFWAWYNLGIMEYTHGRYLQAAEAFKRCLTIKADIAPKYVLASKVLGEIGRNVDLALVFGPERIQQDYRNAALLYNASVSRAKGQTVEIPADLLTLKVF